MTATERIVRTDEIETTTPPTRVRTHWMLAIGAAAIVTLAAFVAVVSTTDQKSTPISVPPTSVMSMNEKLQNLVDRGLIPRQALQPAPLTMEQKLQDLVARGLIPPQALEQAP